MKKRVLLLLPLFLGACSDSGESPVIKIEKLYAKIESDGENTSSDEKDYANQREERLSCNSWGIKFSQFPSCIYLC